jgi:hypothetical protein
MYSTSSNFGFFPVKLSHKSVSYEGFGITAASAGTSSTSPSTTLIPTDQSNEMADPISDPINQSAIEEEKVIEELELF